ncbi:PD-(D/E)XK nuclease family protein [Sulfurospirillum sp. 1307]|jgi:RecB family exonuclease
MTQIFPTSRCIREYYASFLDTNTLVPKALSIAEFEQMSIVVPNRAMVDEDTRILLLKEASKFENFSKLKIERDFLTFLKNSNFLFRFFDELSLNDVSIDDLNSADTYAEFSEHLMILGELLTNYKSLLDSKKLYDRINLNEVYELNEDFINSHDGFFLHVEGFLNRFEIELFKKIAKLKEFKIELKIDNFSKKLISIFKDFDLEVGFSYVLNLSSKKIQSKTSIKNQKTNVDIKSFSSRLLQVSYVVESIAKFVSLGIKAEDVVVITPDESFAKTLKEFDRYKNFNFAMGESFSNTDIYKKISSVDKFLRSNEIEDLYRLNRLGIEKSFIEEISTKWQQKLETSETINILQNFLEGKNDIYERELYSFKALLDRIERLALKDAFKLFLNRLAKQSIDDTNGGKVTVMGLLESRGISYDGVIIVDFSDDFVPKRSSKEMFLNSSLKKLVGLPSLEDRENLQRYYYNNLIKNAKEVAISFVVNEQSMGSRFLDELGLHVKKGVEEKSYVKLLFNSSKKKGFSETDWIEHESQIKTLSASKLKTLLTCKRKYYFRYIKQLKEAKLPTKNLNQADIGNKLHEALKFVFRRLKFVNEELIFKELREYFNDICSDVTDRYLVDVWLEKLKSFAKNEAKRYEEGYRVFELEKPLHVDYGGFKLEGTIDRIDKKDGKFSIIDYKSGNIPLTTLKKLDKHSDFQLEFYYLLSRRYGEIEGLYYYDLNSGELIQESIFEDKLKKLDEILESLKKPLNGYEKCEDLSNCRYCPYTMLCGRDS